MNHQSLYKPTITKSFKDIFAKNVQNSEAVRQKQRLELLWGSRVDINQTETSVSQPVEKKKNPRAEMLKKWKAEKLKRLEEDKKNKKPVFKVGVVHRTATGSPLLAHKNTQLKKNVLPQQSFTKPLATNSETKNSGILTRAKAKNLAVKPPVNVKETKQNSKMGFKHCYKFEQGKRKALDTHTFKVPEVVSKLPSSGLTLPSSPSFVRRSMRKIDSNVLNLDLSKTVEKVKTPASKRVIKEPVSKEKTILKETIEEAEVKKQIEEPEKVVNNLEEDFSSKLKVATPEMKEIPTDDYVPVHYSPFVTVRSKKSSMRRSKKSLVIDVEEQVKKEENEFKCRIFSFRKYIECETKRLLDTCTKWKQIYLEFQEVPSDVEGDIDSLVGKTNLLTSDKFMQFKGLIDKCENGDPFIKIDDLQGFQDWVSIEVEKLDEEFHKLEKRKCNNWELDTNPSGVSKVQKKVTKNVTKKPVGKSNIRSHILAARKMMKEGNTENGNDVIQLPKFEVSIKASTPKKKQSLLKDVLNSETKKKIESSAKKSPSIRKPRNSGLEIMIATQKRKSLLTPSKQLQKSPSLNDYEIVIENEETPSRSILKKTPKTVNTPKGHVTFLSSEKKKRRNRGLSERYFQPSSDIEVTPPRTILGDLGNLSSEGINTRSKTRLLFSARKSPRVN